MQQHTNADCRTGMAAVMANKPGIQPGEILDLLDDISPKIERVKFCNQLKYLSVSERRCIYNHLKSLNAAFTDLLD